MSFLYNTRENRQNSIKQKQLAETLDGLLVEFGDSQKAKVKGFCFVKEKSPHERDTREYKVVSQISRNR